MTLGGVQVGALGASAATGPAVLRVIATASASLVEVTRLRAELAQALREVEASRARLVQVGDAERLRLERDLHDGAQQRLVSLGMAMRLAQRHLGNGTVDVDALLDQGVAELATAIAELRQVAHGLRPSSLEDGLPAALASLTNALPIPVHVRCLPGAARRRRGHHRLLRGRRGDHECGQARERDGNQGPRHSGTRRGRDSGPGRRVRRRGTTKRLRARGSRRPGGCCRRLVADGQPCRSRVRRSRRCFHADRDRRGLRPVPGRVGQPARSTPVTTWSDARPTRTRWSSVVAGHVAGPGHHRRADAAGPHR